MRTALTIAGSDSSGGAGIQADLKTFAAFGVHGASAVTAVTAQSTAGIICTSPLPADVVTAQIEAVAGDIAIHATKTGMLANAAIVEAVAAAIVELDLPLVVVDPVLVSTSGTRLLDDDGLQMLRVELLPRAFITTPNIPEAETLSGIPIATLHDVREAAKRLHGMSGALVLVTGGHGGSHDPMDVIDLLFDGHVFTELRAPRADVGDVRGTGCAFASALAACLALGMTPRDAAARAQQFVGDAIRGAIAIGHGHRILKW